MPYVIHCSDPLEPGQPDNAFVDEATLAIDLGLTSLRIDHGALAAGEMGKALRHLRSETAGRAVYRGWMMRTEAYAALYAALKSRGIELFTTPSDYARAHHLPESHAYIGRWMPETISVPAAEMDNTNTLAAALAAFGNTGITVKDWVKSQASGYWLEACLIPDATDAAAARRVIDRFRDLQGADLVGGLVFRRLIDLQHIDGQPIEWRAFCLNQTAIGCWPRFTGSHDQAPPPDLITAVARALPSPFFSADFALGKDGRWWLMETGDGQVSGFPDGAARPVLSTIAQILIGSAIIA